MQRQSIHFTGSIGVLRYLVTQVAGLLETIEGDRKMRAFNAIDITIEGKVVSLEVCSFLPPFLVWLFLFFFQWVANPINDMYADAVVAAILQAEAVEVPSKNLTSSAKVDRMHFKVRYFI